MQAPRLFCVDESICMDKLNNLRNVIDDHLRNHPAAQFYLLVDHAGLPGLIRKLDCCVMQWNSVFENTRESTALAAAPILVSIGKGGSPVRLFLDWLDCRCAYASAVTLLQSPLEMGTLCNRLANRLEMNLSENMKAMLRFFDTRILTQLRQTLSPDQATSFFSVATHWWWFDRSGTIECAHGSCTLTDDKCIPLQLCQQQEFDMVEASEPDQVLSLLTSEMPMFLAKLPLEQRHDFIKKNLQQAKKAGLDSVHDFAFYVAAALLSDDELFCSRHSSRRSADDQETGR